MIMTGPPDAVVREYQALLKMDGVDLRFSDERPARHRRVLHPPRTGARSLRTHRRGDLPRRDVRGARAQGRDGHDRRDVVEGHLERLAAGAAAGAREESRDLFGPAAQPVLVRVLPAQDRRRAAARWSGRSASWPTWRRRSCPSPTARAARRATKTVELVQLDPARGAPDRDGAPDLRRRQPGGDRRRLDRLVERGHREHHGAARRPARRPGARSSGRRAASATPPT